MSSQINQLANQFRELCIFIGVISSVTSFQCYVCNSMDDPYCYDSPKLRANCPYLSTGCIRLEAEVPHYEFKLPHEAHPLTWNGNSTDWILIQNTTKMVVRKCSNTYARYSHEPGCKVPPMAKDMNEGLICYCESNLCNRGRTQGINGFVALSTLVLISTNNLRICSFIDSLKW